MSPLLTKLRYRPGMRVYIADAPSAYEKAIATLPESVERAAKLSGTFDLVHAFFTRKSQLVRDLPRLRRALRSSGILWLSYPKGQALETDLARDVVREAAAAKGLVTVAQVAIDGLWSALRCKVVD